MKWNKEYFRRVIQHYVNIDDDIDTENAAKRIKDAIWFRGPNAWILAFSIIIASVGLNVNSTAVIIGAMLISPLMGPIIGIGLAIGTNDFELLKNALKSFLVMVLISVAASTLFFLLSPLRLVNPTELVARTSPTIYDVLIALFGGLAGILENSRKERGTVLSGVAIATALMPPLCTAGYGLAHFNPHFFFGALYLFIINTVFIILATYVMVKYLNFNTVKGIDQDRATRRRNLMTCIVLIVTLPSIFTAFNLIKASNFERDVQAFVSENKLVGRTYIYDYRTLRDHGQKVEISVTGERMSKEKRDILTKSAAEHGIKQKQLIIKEKAFGMTENEMRSLIKGIYDKTEQELSSKDARIVKLQARLDSLSEVVKSLAEETREPENKE
jgi:uncharacterized hydrophobic protein (TIGR00271 family)